MGWIIKYILLPYFHAILKVCVDNTGIRDINDKLVDNLSSGLTPFKGHKWDMGVCVKS